MIARVVLSAAEQKLAIEIGRARNNAATNQNIVNRNVAGHDDATINIIGMAGELAFCKAFGLDPDLVISTTDRPKADVTFYDKSWDVKTTPYKNAHLIAPIHKAGKRCDCYALVIGKHPTKNPVYKIVGWVNQADLISEDRIIDLGYGPTYGLRQDQLRPFPETLYKDAPGVLK